MNSVASIGILAAGGIFLLGAIGLVVHLIRKRTPLQVPYMEFDA
jgi:hypothetical protein